LTPDNWVRLGLSIELPTPETSEETELERRVWPVAEKREIAGDAGADESTVSGDCGRRGIVRCEGSPSMRDSCFNMARECLERELEEKGVFRREERNALKRRAA
jgi:hypothetical protein